MCVNCNGEIYVHQLFIDNVLRMIWQIREAF